MCRLALPHLLKNEPSKTGKRGTIVNVASIAGQFVIPTSSSYGVSKIAIMVSLERGKARAGFARTTWAALTP